jgi:hypothetical protein
MKLKQALKYYKFLGKLDLSDDAICCAANHLVRTANGSSEVFATPLAKKCDPIVFLVEWDEVFARNVHKMNKTLLDLERSNRAKFGPRSVSVKWEDRIAGMTSSFSHQSSRHRTHFKLEAGNGKLYPISLREAVSKMKSSSSAGLPFLTKKGAATPKLLADVDAYLDRQDPCMLYTRTTEMKKTRNVWGFPYADTLFETMYYQPILSLHKQMYCRASIVSPDAVAASITELISKAQILDKVLYSVDFAGFDASVKYQYIIAVFEYFKSCFAVDFNPYLDSICKRMYSIGIVTPTGVMKGNHGVPSGSTFTNEVDSMVQLGIASTCSFIHKDECQIQGDDGVYIVSTADIPEFEAAFKRAGLKLEKSKSMIADDCVVFCQNLYHVDYLKDGIIPGIYPTYRAINRILFQERYVDFRAVGMKSSDYFGIRCISILENCKYHPLFEELVRFVLVREKYHLDVSDDGLIKYCDYLNLSKNASLNLNHQYGYDVSGIRDFATVKLVHKILAEEGFEDYVADLMED